MATVCYTSYAMLTSPVATRPEMWAMSTNLTGKRRASECSARCYGNMTATLERYRSVGLCASSGPLAWLSCRERGAAKRTPALPKKPGKPSTGATSLGERALFDGRAGMNAPVASQILRMRA